MSQPDFHDVDEARYWKLANCFLVAGILSLCAAPRTILDVGCGQNWRAPVIAARTGAKVTGLDRENGGDVVGDAQKLAYPTDSFDVCYSYGCFMATQHPWEAVAEAFRVSKWGVVAIERASRFNGAAILDEPVWDWDKYDWLRRFGALKPASLSQAQVYDRSDPDTYRLGYVCYIARKRWPE